MRDAVFLEGLRCDGAAHGGCQALCLIYWREAWLRRADGPPPAKESSRNDSAPSPTPDSRPEADSGREPGVEDLHRHTVRKRVVGATLYRCQATELRSFTRDRGRLDPRPLLDVARSGNVSLGTMASVLGWAFTDKVRRRLRLHPVPRVEGKCSGKTPGGRIEGLEPGDWVEIKTQAEIEATLDPDQKNRGLWFDVEMLPLCGRRTRLIQRVDRIIEERTGAMIELPNDCWIVEGGICSGHVSHSRLFCTRKIYSFWREVWFRRAEGPGETTEPC